MYLPPFKHGAVRLNLRCDARKKRALFKRFKDFTGGKKQIFFVLAIDKYANVFYSIIDSIKPLVNPSISQASQGFGLFF